MMDPVENKSSHIPKARLLTVIALVMIIEHKILSLDELIRATGMSFQEAIESMQNLVNTRLIEVIHSKSNIPSFKLINAEEATNFLELTGINNK